MTQLGTLEDLPAAYRDALTAHNLVPLWPSLRAALPYDIPARRTRPIAWHYADIRPRLLQAGELTPIEKAERRVLVLANPGLGLANMQATPSIYIGLQLILPGETAPNHMHSPSAVRFVVEGQGGYTVVDGEKLPMDKGDLILTPSGLWHEHGHEGSGPVIWLDALDLPTVFALEASYCLEGAPQVLRNQPDASQTFYTRSGFVPFASLNATKPRYPLRRFPWKDAKAALTALAGVTNPGQPVQLAYVNPETGEPCMPVLGFSAIMLRPGETITPWRRSASAVLHVIEGEAQAQIDGVTLDLVESDTVAAPTHARVTLANRSTLRPAFLFQVDDAPMQRKLGFFEEFES
ncbi:Gentisate 1,2 dioxygenase 2 [Rhodovastum atsumiense]|uniref:Cupin domain-containing protein n=1 Tax=Rhodovastum atsumiense TaxID=504468 RepID=A0A5M6IQP5_9PROT|nr:cupin domain-containing protein [Rhodovastum atsumiense]KAA5610600.1 cupin domain-containing protein [Rhodovastum atsumiense]CAH2600717.1 Gentisate 1,2 dioxygenase 2 [Rhodovastum atsumiense]